MEARAKLVARRCWPFQVALLLTVFVVAINFLTMPGDEYPGDADAVRAETITLLQYRQVGGARTHILRAAARQFVEGDVQHWWHPDSGAGVYDAARNVIETHEHAGDFKDPYRSETKSRHAVKRDG